jgi:hypothetical protein
MFPYCEDKKANQDKAPEYHVFHKAPHHES